ncbi:MAG: sigma-70 family RNA polymerase sigma factor [Spiribacter salinus]|uniref:Sigma-70 family RNA polymerase sigma factor n=1 Tax=Spiribacter salinus TaxID=1335746 RepID=A0A540VHN2_9GAMM|nr:MAG: sigma-70 family RNA polymerase sigma factor [Spiribacter salinus]
MIGETWLRIVRGAATYREPEDCRNTIGNLFRWVGTVMRNTLAEVRRKRYWEPLCEIPEDENGQERELPPAFGQTREIEPSRPELAEAVRECIKALRSKQQQVVLWASADYFEYCEERKKMVCEPPEEVRARLSDELGTSDNNICQLRKRALDGLRKCMKNKTGMGG